MQGMENFENRNLVGTSSNDQEVTSGQSESGLDMDLEQGNQLLEVRMLFTLKVKTKFALFHSRKCYFDAIKLKLSLMHSQTS